MSAHPPLALSLSARRAWIEIGNAHAGEHVSPVALRKESVDRNSGKWISMFRLHASLSARRAWIEIGRVRTVIVFCVVALRKESVDRNCTMRRMMPTRCKSLSARRAWIEMVSPLWYSSANTWSLSARRAWIEIAGLQGAHGARCVALRKESVDRNF